MSECQAVIFDIDGTLSPEISWPALTRDLGASVDAHVKIYQDYRNGVTNYGQSKGELLTLWQATGNANKSYFQHLFESWPLDDAAEQTVKLVSSVYPVCLITGSMDLYAATVAAKLNVADFYSNTVLHWSTTGQLIDMDYELDQASKKLKQFLGYCAAHNIEPTQTIVVGDGENDVELFKASGYGIAIGSAIPPELSQVAWKSIAQLNELPAAIGLPAL